MKTPGDCTNPSCKLCTLSREQDRKGAIRKSLRTVGVILSGGRLFTTPEAAECAARGLL